MCQNLPTGEFKWPSKKEINKTDLAKSDKDHLHDLRSDYPLGPEQVEVTEYMLSEYWQKNPEQIWNINRPIE